MCGWSEEAKDGSSVAARCAGFQDPSRMSKKPTKYSRHICHVSFLLNCGARFPQRLNTPELLGWYEASEPNKLRAYGDNGCDVAIV